VVLIESGERLPGESDLQVQHAYYRYNFADAANRAAFLAHPERYEIQLGGACARMGALSSVGRPDLFTVHQDKLYIFASEACRERFSADPHSVLEPIVDPLPRIHIYAAGLGGQVFESCVQWLGGEQVIDQSEIEWSFEQQADYGEGPVLAAQLQEIGPGARYRMENRWGDNKRVKELEGDQAYLLDPGIGLRSAAFSQLRALDRQAQQHLLAIFASRSSEDLHLAAVPTDQDGVVELMVLVHLIQHNLGVREATGEILWHEYGGYGSDITYGQIREDFLRWEQHGGLRVPVAWKRSFNGEFLVEVDRPAEGWKLKVLRHQQAK